jgi:hypothetical protein
MPRTAVHGVFIHETSCDERGYKLCETAPSTASSVVSIRRVDRSALGEFLGKRAGFRQLGFIVGSRRRIAAPFGEKHRGVMPVLMVNDIALDRDAAPISFDIGANSHRRVDVRVPAGRDSGAFCSTIVVAGGGGGFE